MKALIIQSSLIIQFAKLVAFTITVFTNRMRRWFSDSIAHWDDVYLILARTRSLYETSPFHQSRHGRAIASEKFSFIFKAIKWLQTSRAIKEEGKSRDRDEPWLRRFNRPIVEMTCENLRLLGENLSLIGCQFANKRAVIGKKDHETLVKLSLRANIIFAFGLRVAFVNEEGDIFP